MKPLNENLNIQVLANSGNFDFGNDRPPVQEGIAIVKITDKSRDNKETIFHIGRVGSSFLPSCTLPDDANGDFSKLIVHLDSLERWDKCNKQRERLDVYEGEGLLYAMAEECQNIYNRILRENKW